MFIVTRVNDVRFITEETKQIIIKQEQEFTPEKLKAYILELNIRFPHIVYAQALLESGEFKSHIFKENNNFFGMKQAKQRPTTNKGTENGHAYFVNWRDCVVDYAFYQAAYLNDLRSESEYFEYLGQNYAEDPGYVGKLKKIIEKINNPIRLEVLPKIEEPKVLHNPFFHVNPFYHGSYTKDVKKE
jgi:uncharacterized FlgJ-related protein